MLCFIINRSIINYIALTYCIMINVPKAKLKQRYLFYYCRCSLLVILQKYFIFAQRLLRKTYNKKCKI